VTFARRSPSRPAVSASLALVVALAMLAGCTPGRGGSVLPQAGPASSLPTIDPGEDPVVGVVQAVRPAVVSVTTNVPSPSLGGGPGQGTGTGFVVRADGFVVTNFHVVEGALNIRVVTADGKRFEARVVGGDPDADLAVLKVGARGLPIVPLGDSERLELGERVVAIGFALALQGGPSVTSGIVSALGRTIQASDPNDPGGDRTYEDLIQTDAAINPGNSGGPLVDLAGRVIGINTAGVRAAEAENIGFAIAINRARPVIEGAIRDPERPAAYLGVSTQTVTAALALQLDLPVDQGALVRGTAPGGPADRAGIDVGDVIVSFDGRTVRSSEEVGTLVIGHEPGDRVEVGVVHPSGDEETFTVDLGVRPLPVP
jgi:serine protease Do